MRVRTEVETYISRKLSRYADISHFEDAVQEGLIQYWKDEDGGYDEGHRYARAVMRSKAILLQRTGLSQGSTYTGHIRKSSDGWSRPGGELAREKISNYQTEYQNLHGKMPTNTEIAKALGMHKTTVGEHLKKMRTQGVSVPLNEVKVSSISDTLSEEGQHIAFIRHAEEFEAELLDRILVRELLEMLSEKERTIIVGTHWYGYSTRQLGDLVGTTQSSIRRCLSGAYDKMRELMSA